MPDIDTLTEAIQAHLACHPMAADSAEGVARWWLAGYGLQASAAEVEHALTALVSRGQLCSVRLADGRTLYRGGGARDGLPPWRM